jgi:acyl carrier protein
VEELEAELKRLIIETLRLPDVSVEQIDPAAPLFGAGLGLDSIDALELAMEIRKRYGVRIRQDDAQNREIFSSVRTLAAFIASNRQENRT